MRNKVHVKCKKERSKGEEHEMGIVRVDVL